MFLYSCNTTATADVESVALAVFGGIQKKLERGEWLTSTTVWVDRPAQKEEGRRKYDGHGIGATLSGGGSGRDAVFNHGVYPQMRIMERLGYMTAEERSENLRIPLEEDGREIFLRFLSKGYYIRSCTRSYAPVRG